MITIKNFNKEYLKYLFPQRTRLTTEYSLNHDSEQEKVDAAINLMIQKDYDMISPYLPTTCSDTLDIGCGIGLINIAIYNHYNKSINLHLLDKTELNTEKISGFNEKYKFYNSMDAAKDIATVNGVNDNQVHLFEATNYQSLFNKKFDVISSFLSCGWHFHVKEYSKLMTDTLTNNGILILDIRHNTDQLEHLLETFTLKKQIYNYAESKHTGGNIGDRYIFRKK